MKEFLTKQKKFVNGWAITRDGSPLGSAGNIVMVYNTPQGRFRKCIPYKDCWYFYVKKDQNAQKVLTEKGVRHAVGQNWIRVFYPKIAFNDDNVTQFVRELESAGVKTYEADLGPVKRLMLDYDLQIEDWENLKVLYFDIETDDTKGDIAIGRDRILSFAAVDQKGNEYYLSDKDEGKLLFEVDKLIRNFDMLIGWNSKDFDLPYLIKRFHHCRISTEYLWNILHEDMMRRLQYFYMKDPEARQSLTSYSLDFCSQYFLKEGKVERKEKVIELFEKNPAKLKEYNLQDARLLYRLEQKLGLIKVTHQMFQWCQVFPQNWTMVKTIDNFILSHSNKKGIHYPTNYAQMFKKEEAEKEQNGEAQYLGAYVIDPKPGSYKDVFVLDFKSLYPNIIRTFNISPETLSEDGDISIPTVWADGSKHGGAKFRSATGIVPEKIGLLLEQRAEIRKKMKDPKLTDEEKRNLDVKQLVVKELANSIYGVMGNRWFRSFSITLAESITATGRYLLDQSKNYLEETGRTVIYGDTDSLFMIPKGKEDIDKIIKDLNAYLADHLKKNFGVKESFIEIGLDKQFEQFLIETKKKYAGIQDGKLKYKGMECVKRDTVPVAVNYQKKLFGKIFEGETIKNIHKWIAEKKETVQTKDFDPKDISISKRVNKGLATYKSDLIHIRIAKSLKEKNKEESSSTIVTYIITQGGHGSKMDGVHISEFKGQWDRTYYWNNVIYPILERVLEAAYPQEDWHQYYIEKTKTRKTKETSKGRSGSVIKKGGTKK